MADYSEELKLIRGELERFSTSASKSNGLISSLGKSILNTGSSTEKLKLSIGNLNSGFSQLSGLVTKSIGTIQSLGHQIAGAFGAKSVIDNLANYNKGLYDLSRQATIVGQTFGMVTKGLDEIQKKTNLSRTESVNLFKTMQDGILGMKLMHTEISNLSKLLGDEFGPTLKNIQDGFKSLSDIQQKDIFLFQRLKEGMKGPELIAYISTLSKAYNISQQQMETLLRVNKQRIMGAAALSEEEKRLRAFHDVQQKFSKSFQDLIIQVGKPLMEVFTQAIIPLTKFGAQLTSLIEKNKGLANAIGGVAQIAAFMGIASTISTAISSTVGSLMKVVSLIFKATGLGGITKLLGGGLMGAGSPSGKSHDPIYVKLSGTSPISKLGGFLTGGDPRVSKLVERSATRGKLIGRSMPKLMGGKTGKVSGLAAGAGILGGILSGGAKIVGGIAASILGGPIGIAIATITALSLAIGPLIASFKTLAQTLGIPEKSIKNLSSIFNNIQKDIKPVMDGLWKIFKDIGSKFLETIIPIAETIYKNIQPLIIPVGNMLKQVISSVGSLGNSLIQLGGVVIKMLTPAMSKMVETLATTLNVLAVGLGVAAEAISDFVDRIERGESYEAQRKRKEKERLERRGEEGGKIFKDTGEKIFAHAYQGELANILGKEIGDVLKEDVSNLFEKSKDIIGAKGTLNEFLKQGYNLQTRQFEENSSIINEFLNVAKHIQEAEKIGVTPPKDKPEMARFLLRKEMVSGAIGTEEKRLGLTGDTAQKFRAKQFQAAMQGEVKALTPAVISALEDGLRGINFDKMISKLKSMPFAEKIADFRSITEEIKSSSAYAELLVQKLMFMEARLSKVKEYAEGSRAAFSSAADFASSFENNIEKARQKLQQSLSITELELKINKETNEERLKNVKTTLKQIEQQKIYAQKTGDQETLNRLVLDELTNKKVIQELESEILEIINKRQVVSLRIANISQERLSVLELESQSIEAQLNLTKSLYGGMTPTLALQGQILNTLEKQKELVESMAEDVTKEYQKGIIGVIPYQQKILDLQIKQTNIIQRQVDLTKNLRDQYLDAITAFTQVEGAFSKFVITREAGLGFAIRNMGVRGGFELGTKGVGLSQPAMQWMPGGGLKFSPMNQIQQLFKQVSMSAGYNQAFAPIFGGWAEKTPGGLTSIINKGVDFGKSEKLRGVGSQVRAEIEGASKANLGGIGTEPWKSIIDRLDMINTSINSQTISSSKENKENLKTYDKQEKTIKTSVETQKTSNENVSESSDRQKIIGNMLIKQIFEMQEANGNVKNTIDKLSETKKKEEEKTKEFSIKIPESIQQNADQSKREQNIEMKNFSKGIKVSTELSEKLEAEKNIEMKNFGKSIKVSAELAEKLEAEKKDITSLPGIKKVLESSHEEEEQNKTKPTKSNYSQKLEEIIEEDPVYKMSKGGPIFYQSGGKIPGFGGGDKIPALLEQGEFIVNKDAAKIFYPLLSIINAKKMATGGPVIPNPMTATGSIGSPRININVKGDSAGSILKVVNDELGQALSEIMTPIGSNGRYYDMSNNGSR